MKVGDRTTPTALDNLDWQPECGVGNYPHPAQWLAHCPHCRATQASNGVCTPHRHAMDRDLADYLHTCKDCGHAGVGPSGYTWSRI